MRLYAVYDMNNFGQCIMIDSAKKVARELKCTAKKVRDYSSKRLLINKRYKVIKYEC